MKPSIGYCILICIGTTVVVLAIACPTIINDKNEFLKGFVNHELLNILGLIAAITIGSAAQLHLRLNDIERSRSTSGAFTKTRKVIHRATYWLIAIFLLSLILVIIKPLLATEN